MYPLNLKRQINQIKIHTMTKNEVSTILQIFQIKFGSLLRKKHKGASELLLLLSLGLTQKWSSVKSVSDHLGVNKDKCYNTLKKIPLRTWRKLFESCFKQEVYESVKAIQDQSASTISRSNISIQIDDSVLRKWMGRAYFYKWYSGQYKKVVGGYDVVLVSIVIQGRVLPLQFWLMGKTGPHKKRPNRAAKLLEDLAKELKTNGIDISKIPVSADSAYLTSDLKDALVGLGFKVALGTKGHYKVHTHKYAEVYTKDSLAIREVFQKSDYDELPSEQWGMEDKVISRKIKSGKWGEALLLESIQLGKPRRVLFFGINRTCEAWRIWKNHHFVERIFRHLKHLLSWGKYSLQGRDGAYATVVIPFLAFWLLSELQKKCKLSFERIILALQVWVNEDLDELIELLNLEHFHVNLPTFDSIMGSSG